MRQPRRLGDIKVVFLNGLEQTFTFKPCKRCEGRGKCISYPPADCITCNGIGVVLYIKISK